MSAADYTFAHLEGKKLVKLPGSIKGNGFVLDHLKDCEVYILDYTAQVQVDDCIGCKIFIGPCDGSVFIRDCSNCTLCVATRQFRTRDCKDLDVALYCCSQPSIETSVNVKFSCWRGAYPGLTQHFKAADLDPATNTWDKVYDFNNGEDLGAPHYSVDTGFDGTWWEVAGLEGLQGPCENPVLAADGSRYVYTPGAPAPAAQGQQAGQVEQPPAAQAKAVAPEVPPTQAAPLAQAQAKKAEPTALAAPQAPQPQAPAAGAPLLPQPAVAPEPAAATAAATLLPACVRDYVQRVPCVCWGYLAASLAGVVALGLGLGLAYQRPGRK